MNDHLHSKSTGRSLIIHNTKNFESDDTRKIESEMLKYSPGDYNGFPRSTQKYDPVSKIIYPTTTSQLILFVIQYSED